MEGTNQERILVVDDEPLIRNLLVASLNSEQYSCKQAANADQASLIIQQEDIDLAILDMMMPGRSGAELLKEIKEKNRDIAVLMVTAHDSTETAMSCIRNGAEDYIIKPFSIDRIIVTVRNSLEKKRLSLENRTYQLHLEQKIEEQTLQIKRTLLELNKSYGQTLSALVKALDAREKEVGSHSERVMDFTLLLAATMGLGNKDTDSLARGALLHDIGKIGVADQILLKPGKLNETEWHQMKTHPETGYAILAGISFLEGSAEIVLSHHEQFNGSGYPRQLRGEEIPLGSRIFALADTLDAMTSDRPYRAALSYQATVDEIKRCTGSQFDPAIVDVFLSIDREKWEDVAKKTFT